MTIDIWVHFCTLNLSMYLSLYQYHTIMIAIVLLLFSSVSLFTISSILVLKPYNYVLEVLYLFFLLLSSIIFNIVIHFVFPYKICNKFLISTKYLLRLLLRLC